MTGRGNDDGIDTPPAPMPDARPDPARLVTLVPDALDLPPEDRADFLDRACRRPTGELDRALLAEAEALVRAAEAALAGGELASPVPGILGGLAEAERLGRHAPPETVGPWRVTGVLGEGGQGVVYRAVRADGAFEREVALKLLRPGAASPRLEARLAEERRVLGRLEHPGIARLYDGGVDDGGRPYLAMELVDGAPITDHAGDRGLDVRQCVELLAAVCDAVAYAHARLVVHRDLKPSNVLVSDGGPDGRGRPTLLDFGVAKLLGDDTDPALTVPGWMTPAYAAPEQVTGGEVTTATDVYALGVLAYEVLTGRRPYETAGLSPAEFERVVAEADPPAPSARAPTDVARALRGDLDTVVMKALAKGPSRRYPTAAALADDLRRWLGGMPVEARPATAAYRAGRFVRRHRAAVAAAALGALLLAGWAATATVQGARVAAERDRAETEAAKAEAVNEFVLGILGASAPDAQGRDVTVAEALDRAAARADSALIGEPEIEGAVRYHLGFTYLNLSRVDEAEREFRRAIGLFRESVGPDHPSTIDALQGLAYVHFTRGDFDRGDGPLREAVRAARTHGDAELARLASLTSDLHVARQQSGDPEGALALLRESAAIRARMPDPDPEQAAILQGNMAVILHDLGREQESLDMRRRALDYWRSVYPAGSYQSVQAVMGYAQQLHEVGRPAEAAPLLAEAVGVYREAASDGATAPYDLVHALVVQAVVLTDAGRLGAAEAAVTEAAELVERALPAGDHMEGRVAAAKAGLHAARSEWAGAVAQADRAVAVFSETRGAASDGVGHTLLVKARALRGAGRDAGPTLRRARAVFADRYGEAHPAVAEADSLLDLAGT